MEAGLEGAGWEGRGLGGAGPGWKRAREAWRGGAETGYASSRAYGREDRPAQPCVFLWTHPTTLLTSSPEAWACSQA